MADDRARRVARSAVALIIKDLSDRRGFRQEWEGIDDDIQDEIRERWVSLVEGEILEEQDDGERS